MKLVKIVHPNAGEAQVPESSVAHWRSSGWERAPEAPAETQPKTDEEPAGETADQGKPSGKPRRRTNEGE